MPQASARHASPAKAVGAAGTVEGAAPIVRGKVEMRRTGTACSANAASAMLPVRGNRHGVAIPSTTRMAVQKTTACARIKPTQTQDGPHERLQREVQASTDVAASRIPEVPRTTRRSATTAPAQARRVNASIPLAYGAGSAVEARADSVTSSRPARPGWESGHRHRKSIGFGADTPPGPRVAV